MQKEYQLILNVMLRRRTEEEESQLNKLLAEPLNWELIGGQVINHRLGGYFFNSLNKEQLKYVPKEMKKALELLVLAQKQQTLEIINVISPILEEFDNENIRYAGLKGIVFNAELYNPGDRRSNDTDLLVYEDDLEKLDSILRRNGYIQSFMENNELKEASRKEKLIQRMNYHDLVPYVKLIGSEFVDKHEIDINFHFDSKENNITRDVFDRGTVIYKNNYYSVKGLPWDTNLAHLCVHFFREATNSLWTNGKRDVTLYKVVDVVNTIRSCKENSEIKKWPDLMKSLNLQKAAYYTLFVLGQFYKDDTIKFLMEELEPQDTSYLDDIKIEGENRVMKRTESFIDSAFDLIK